MRESTENFIYESHGRTWITLGGLFIGLLMLAIAAASGAPTVIYLVLALFLSGMGYLVIWSPRAGMRITGRRLIIWRGEQAKEIALNDIEVVRIQSWSDSTDVTVCLKNGDTVDIFDRCRPTTPELVVALEQAGVTVAQN